MCHLHVDGAVNAEAALTAAVAAADDDVAAADVAAVDRNGTGLRLFCHQLLLHQAHYHQMLVVQVRQHAVPAAAGAAQLLL